MLFNKKFDLIVSIGEDCACTSYLRRFNLQKYSYPFDWLSNASFETRISLLVNDFEGFLNPENIEFLDIENHTDCDSYMDIKSKFHFYHDFKKGKTLEENYNIVKDKYNRRINRLYSQIDNSKNILFVWWSKDKIQDVEEIKNAYFSLKNKFNTKNISLLCIENSSKKEDIDFFDGNLLILHYDNASYQHNPKWNKTMGNETNNIKVFRQIHINKTFADNLSDVFYRILKFLINFIPIRNLRHNYRDKINFYKYHAKL